MKKLMLLSALAVLAAPVASAGGVLAADSSSSGTYTIFLEDSENTLGDSPICYPYCETVTPVSWWLAGDTQDGASGWDQKNAKRMIGHDEDRGLIQRVYLEKDFEFKVTNYKSYYGYSYLKDGTAKSNFSGEGDSNIKVLTAGYYDISIDLSYQITINSSTVESAFSWSDGIVGTKSNGVTAFTIDASKFPSATTQLVFSSADNSNATQSYSVKSILEETRTVSVDERMVYLYPDKDWGSASAWFLGEFSNDNSNIYIKFEKYGSTDYYYAKISASYTDFYVYRMDPNSPSIPAADKFSYWNKSNSKFSLADGCYIYCHTGYGNWDYFPEQSYDLPPSFPSYTVSSSASVYQAVTLDYGYDDKKELLVVKNGDKISKTPERTADEFYSYEFGGWYTDSAHENSFETTIGVTSDLTLYAKWNKTSTDKLAALESYETMASLSYKYSSNTVTQEDSTEKVVYTVSDVAIRFGALIKKADYEYFAEKGLITHFGVTLKTGSVTKDNVCAVAEKTPYYDEANEQYIFNAYVAVDEANYATEITATAYLKYGDNGPTITQFKEKTFSVKTIAKAYIDGDYLTEGQKADAELVGSLKYLAEIGE